MLCRSTVVVLSLLAFVVPATASAAIDPAATVERSSTTGAVRFVGMPAGTADAGARATRAAATPAAAGRAYLEENADAFGLDGSTVSALRAETVAGGGTAVRYQQTIGGVEVLGGQFAVQLTPARRVRSVMGEAVPDAVVDTTPQLSADAARAAAVASVAKAHRVPAADLRADGAATLKIFDSRIMGGPGLEVPQLVWETLVRDGAGTISDRVYVEADRGYEVATISGLHGAKQRTVCDAGGTVLQSVPPNSPCAPAASKRSEGQPAVAGPGAADINDAYDFAGSTYDFFASRFGRDSLDGKGLPLRSTVRFCPPDECPYINAFWDDAALQMTYGAGFASADDVVGHELAHGVTDFTSGLYYYFQSGAINESLSDVFGEMVDQGNGLGTDTPATKWQLGEDLPPAIGVIRDMQDPTSVPDPDPDRMGSPLYTDDETDSGGVHDNSGVSNKAAYLIADGDTFNGRTITGIGVEKTAQIYYRVETAYLTSASDYLDLGTALGQACSDLVGGPSGMTAGDCEQVAKAVAATEMLSNTRALANPPACTPGVASRDWLADDMEQPGTLARWAPHVIVGPSGPGDAPGWYLGSETPYGDLTYATSAVTQLFGDNLDQRRDWAAEQAAPVAIRPGARLVFRHAYGFEDYDPTDPTVPNDPNDREQYDGGVVEYTTGTGAGAVWQPLPGVAYPGAITVMGGDPLADRNPLEGRSAFVSESRGYVTSVTALDGLVGQHVRFRFRIASDATGGGEGWHIDDVAVTICDGTPPETTVTSGPADGTQLPTGSAPAYAFASNEADGAIECRVDGAAFAACPGALTAAGLGAGAHTVEARARDFVGNVDPTPAARTFTIVAPAGPPAPPGPPTPPVSPAPQPPIVGPDAPRAAFVGKPKRSGNRVTFTVTAPAAGTARVTGTTRIKRGRRTVTVKLGSASTSATGARRVTVRLELPRDAVRLLRTRALRGTFTLTFTPRGGKAQTAKTTYTLAKARAR